MPSSMPYQNPGRQMIGAHVSHRRPKRDLRGQGADAYQRMLRNQKQKDDPNQDLLEALRRRLAIARNRTAGIGQKGVEAIREGAPNAAALRQRRDVALGLAAQGSYEPATPVHELPPQTVRMIQPQRVEVRPEDLKRRLRSPRRKPQFRNQGRPVV